MKTILLIDDEINLLNAYSLMLEKKGFRVLKAINGNEGLKIMLSEDIDLVVSDIYMPQKNGLVVIKQIRRILKYRNIPIIILSAGGTKKNVYTSIGLGINAFLIKPCLMEKLYQTVEEVLSSRNNFKNVLDISKIDNDIDYSIFP
jgi:DNA-binding response OmpR family regulator